MTTLTADELLTLSNLSPIIDAASPADLGILVDYITDNGQGRLSLDSDACRRLVGARATETYDASTRALISNEILDFGGNTLGNIYRKARNAIPFGSVFDELLPSARYAVPYEEIVRDVASHLKVPSAKGSTVAELEDSILRTILGHALDKMSDEERLQLVRELGVPERGITQASLAVLLATGRLSGFATYRMAAIVANAVAKALVGRGLAFGAGATLMRGINIALGPIGWAVTALWTLADLASPAYRVTVPCVVQVAYIRRQLVAGLLYTACPSCSQGVQKSDRFCPSCGTSLEIVS